MALCRLFWYSSSLPPSRTFTHPAAVKGINNNVVAAFGAKVTNFFYLTSDDGGSSYGHAPIEADSGAVYRAMSEVAGTFGSAYYGQFIGNPLLGAGHAMRSALEATSSGRYGRTSLWVADGAANGSVPRWRTWWETWEKVRRCFEMVQEYEARRRVVFDWVLRLRPDLWFFRPLPHVSTLDVKSLYIPAGIVACKVLPCLNDHLAIIPRAHADQYFGLASVMTTCETRECAWSFAKDIALEYTTYLYRRLVTQHQLSLASPPLALAYTILRPCGASARPSSTRAGGQSGSSPSPSSNTNSSHPAVTAAPECHRLLDHPFERLAGLTLANGTKLATGAATSLQLLRYHATCFCEWLARDEGFCPNGAGSAWRQPGSTPGSASHSGTRMQRIAQTTCLSGQVDPDIRKRISRRRPEAANAKKVDQKPLFFPKAGAKNAWLRRFGDVERKGWAVDQLDQYLSLRRGQAGR